MTAIPPEQRFFIAFGQVWCENQTEQKARVLAKTDPHSSGEWRVKGTVQNFDEFGKAFGCKVGQPMMPVEFLPGLVEVQRVNRPVGSHFFAARRMVTI